MRSLPMNERFNEFMSRIGDLAMLNIAWIICCIPVVTVGASTAALYEVIRSMREGYDAHVLRQFFTAFPRNFRRNLTLTAICIVFIALAAFDLWYLSKYMGSTSLGPIGYGAVLTIAVVLLAGAGFIFPVASRSKLSVREQIAQSFTIALRHTGTAVVVLGIVGLPFVIATFVPGGLAFVIFFWGLLFSGISAWLIIALMVHSSIITDAQEPAASEQSTRKNAV